MTKESAGTNPGWRGRALRYLRRSAFAVALAAVLVASIRSSIASVYRVSGSDAPSLLLGDTVVVNRAAYDLRLPFTGWLVARMGPVRRGDMILVSLPGGRSSAFKRVVGLAGDTVGLVDNRLRLNGVFAGYEPVDRTLFAGIDPRNHLGAEVERELIDGRAHLVTFTAGAPRQASSTVRVPPGHYFLLGDNRDQSIDSRAFGPVPHGAVIGQVVSGLKQY